MLFISAYQSRLSKSRDDYGLFLDNVTLIRKYFSCAKCRRNFADFIRTNPPQKAVDKNAAFEWVFSAMNHANVMAGKQQSPDFASVLATFAGIFEDAK